MVILKILAICVIINEAKTIEILEKIPKCIKDEKLIARGMNVPARVKRELPGGHNIRLYCEKNGPLYGNVVTGTDYVKTGNGYVIGPQKFKLLFDTGSLPTWIYGYKNKKSYNHYIGPKAHREFGRPIDPVTQMNISYVDGSWAVGKYYYDYFCLDKGYCASEQCFGVVFYEGSARNGKIDGVFGLANFMDPTPYKRTSREDIDTYLTHYSNLRSIMKEHGEIEMMSLWLHPKGGILTIGSQNEKLYKGDVHWFQVQENPRKYWQIKGLQADLGLRPYKMTTVILNSGIEEILAPNHVVDEMYFFIGANEKGYFKCDDFAKLSEFQFKFNGDTVIMNPEEYVIRESKKLILECCRLGIKNSNSLDVWHLGLMFMRKRYIIFNFQLSEVGFANPVVPF